MKSNIEELIKAKLLSFGRWSDDSHELNDIISYILSLLAKQHEESFKAGRKEIEKELMCELRDPCGTIWEHAKMLQDKLEKQQAEHKALMKKIEKMIVEINIYDDHSSKCYNEIMELLKNVGV